MNTDTSKKSKEAPIFDVVVVGGGPAGMMSAGRAAERRGVAERGAEGPERSRRAEILLIEKNESLGKKLLLTGGGRCNLTNEELDTRKFLEKFKEGGKYLFSAFSQFSVKETLDFFHGRKLETKTEAGQRVFPITDKAQSVFDVLVEYMKQGKVTVFSNSTVIGFEMDGKNIKGVKLADGRLIRAKQFILATGGKSRPDTGSTGEGFIWLKKLGHKVAEPSASLVPVAVKDEWAKRLQGVTLDKVKITIFQNDAKQSSSVGRILFTHFGLSGPTILNMSRDIGELLKYGEVTISLDLLPDFDYDQLNTKLQEVFKEHSNKKFKNSLSTLLTPAIAPVIVELSGIDDETWSHSITREERLKLVKFLKAVPIQVKELLGVEKAIVTSGGVELDEVDFKTMRSRIVPNLFLVGDILNIDRPSGGYSLQLSWTTGFVAGNSVEI